MVETGTMEGVRGEIRKAGRKQAGRQKDRKGNRKEEGRQEGREGGRERGKESWRERGKERECVSSLEDPALRIANKSVLWTVKHSFPLYLSFWETEILITSLREGIMVSVVHRNSSISNHLGDELLSMLWNIILITSTELGRPTHREWQCALGKETWTRDDGAECELNFSTQACINVVFWLQTAHARCFRFDAVTSFP